MSTVKSSTTQKQSQHRLPTGKPWSVLSHILSKSTIKTCVEEFGFPSMTAVQSASIPAFLSHKDLCVQAVTGSGKTLSFVIPMIEILTSLADPLKRHDVGGIILTPTRELAQQINAVVSQFTKKQPQSKQLTSAICIGGKSPEHENAHLRAFGANIIIATPGRLDALLKAGKILNFRALEVLILDEADRLLEFGYQANINSILQMLPKQRRTGLFSATLTEEVEELARVGLRNPVKITLKVQYKNKGDGLSPSPSSISTLDGKKPSSPEDGDGLSDSTPSSASSSTTTPTHQAIPSTLTNYYGFVRPDERLIHLANFIRDHPTSKIMVFFLTCADVDFFYRVVASYPPIAEQFAITSPDTLNSVGLSHLIRHTIKGQRKLPDEKKLPILCDLHGQMKQTRRERVYKEFREAAAGVLFCTDVAARGIDIPDINWVIQFSAPQNPEFFIHRIGRAARAGQQGHALVYLLPSEDSFIELMRDKHVPMIEYPQPLEVSQEDITALYTPAKEEYYTVPMIEDDSDGDDANNDEDDEDEDDEDEDDEDGEDDGMSDGGEDTKQPKEKQSGGKPQQAPSKESTHAGKDHIKKRAPYNKDDPKGKQGEQQKKPKLHHKPAQEPSQVIEYDLDAADEDDEDEDDEDDSESVDASALLAKKKAKTGEHDGQSQKIVQLSSSVTEPKPEKVDIDALEPFPEYRDKSFYNTYKLLKVQSTNENNKHNKKLEKQLEFKRRKEEEAARKEAMSHRLPIHIRAQLLHDTTNIITHTRYLLSYDRHLFDIAAKAYVSHINAYKEHQCKLIFVFDHLPFVHLALGYGLFILPQLPDLKKYNLTYPRISRIDHRFIPYHNDSIATAKQKQLLKRKQRNELEKRRRIQREADQKKYREKQKQIRDKKHKNKVKKTYEEFKQEYDELADEYRKMKKSKKKR